MRVGVTSASILSPARPSPALFLDPRRLAVAADATPCRARAAVRAWALHIPSLARWETTCWSPNRSAAAWHNRTCMAPQTAGGACATAVGSGLRVQMDAQTKRAAAGWCLCNGPMQGCVSGLPPLFLSFLARCYFAHPLFLLLFLFIPFPSCLPSVMDLHHHHHNHPFLNPPNNHQLPKIIA